VEVLGSMIEPACQLFGFQPQRADKIYTPGEIPAQVFTALRDWELVIADLSGANPNVMYELMFRHLTGKCSIPIAEHGSLPFDVQWIRAVQFVPTEAGFLDGRKRLELAIAAVLENGCGELTVQRLFQGGTTDDVSRHRAANGGVATAERSATFSIDAVVVPGDQPEPGAAELGFLDILAETETVLPELAETIAAIGEAVTHLGDITKAATAEFNPEMGARDRLVVVAKYAAAIEPEAAQLERLVATYEANVGIADRGATYLLDQIETDTSLKEAADSMLRSFVTLGETAVGSLKSTEGMAASAEGLTKISRVLRGPAGRIAFTLRRLVSASQPLLRWAERSASILEVT
jgi:hypothetical protein